MNVSSIHSLFPFSLLRLNNIISVSFSPHGSHFLGLWSFLFVLDYILVSLFYFLSFFPFCGIHTSQLGSTVESCLVSKTTFYDVHSYLYILGHICRSPNTGLSRTNDLLKLCGPQGLGRCHLLHMCITAHMKYLAFALTGMHCFFHSVCQIWNRTCWKLNLSSSMPAALPSSVPSVCLVSLLSLQWWWQSSAERLGNSRCAHFLHLFLSQPQKHWEPLWRVTERGQDLSIGTHCSNALGSAEQGGSLTILGSRRGVILPKPRLPMQAGWAGGPTTYIHTHTQSPVSPKLS